MASLAQAEVRWANLPAPAGRRPVLVLTRTAVLPHRSSVTVAPFNIGRLWRQSVLTVCVTASGGVDGNRRLWHGASDCAEKR